MADDATASSAAALKRRRPDVSESEKSETDCSGTTLPLVKRRADAGFETAEPFSAAASTHPTTGQAAGHVPHSVSAGVAAALERLASQELHIVEQASRHLALYVADGSAVSSQAEVILVKLFNAARAHKTSVQLALSMSLSFAAAFAAGTAMDSELVSDAIDCIVSSLHCHSSDRQLLIGGWQAINGALKCHGAALSPLYRDISIAGVRALQTWEADVKVFRSVCNALAELAFTGAGGCAELLAAGSLEHISTLLKRHCADAGVASCCCKLLSCLGPATSDIGDALVDVLLVHAEDADVATAGLLAISQLAASPAAVDALLVGGVGQVLVAELRLHAVAALPLDRFSACCQAIHHIAAHCIPADFLACDFHRAMVPIISSATDLEVGLQALLALSTVAEVGTTDTEYLSAMVDGGAAAPVMRLMGRFRRESRIVYQGCRVLKLLSFGLRDCHVLHQSGASDAVIDAMIDHPGHAAICADACRVLHLLAKHPDNRDSLARGRVLDALLSTVTDWDGPLSDDACCVLEFLLECEAANDLLIAERLYKAIVAVVERTHSPGIVERVCNTIERRLKVRPNIKHVECLLRLGAAEALSKASACFLDIDVAVVSHISATLHMLLRNASKSDLFVLDEHSVGAALADVVACPRTEHEAKVNALRAIRKLLDASTHLTASASLLHHAATAAIAALSISSLPRLSALHGCAIIAHLSCTDAASVRALLRAGAVEFVVRASSFYCADRTIAADVCSGVGHLAVGSVLMDFTGSRWTPFADGSAVHAVVDCMEQHCGRRRLAAAGGDTVDVANASYNVASAGLKSLIILTLTMPDTAKSRLDWPSIVQLILHVAALKPSDFSDSDDAGGDQDLSALAALLFCLVERVMDKMPLRLHGSMKLRFHAGLLWEVLHGSPASLTAAVTRAQAVACAASDVELDAHLALRLACFAGRVGIVDVLLTRFFPDPDDALVALVLATQIAASTGNMELLEHLLTRWHSEPDESGDKLLCLAAQNGHAQVVERLLREEDVMELLIDPESDGAPIWLAATAGHVGVLEHLLADPRVDPSASRNAALRAAASGGHVAVVSRLLADGRVDPCAGGGVRRVGLRMSAFAEAARHGHVDVLQHLLADPRADAACFVREQLDAEEPLELPLSARHALRCWPTCLRVMLQHANAYGVEKYFPRGFAGAHVRGIGEAAWRRRRAAILAWETA